MTQEVREAYLKEVFPKELQEFQHYDSQSDDAVVRRIRKDYQGGQSDPIDEAVSSAKLSELLSKTSLYHHKLTEDLMGSKPKTKVIVFPESSFLASVTLAAQNRLSLIMFLRFREDESHLLLEMNSEGRIYGLPPELMSENQDLSKLLLLDLLTPTLESFRKFYPRVEEKMSDSTTEPSIIPAAFGIERQTLPLKGEDRISGSKRFRRRVKMIADVLLDQPLSPEVQSPALTVNYSEDDIIRDLGKNAQPADIARIKSVIERFKNGGTRAKSLVASREGSIELRAGRYRILLLPGEKGKFVYHKVLHRKELGNRKTQRQVTV
jgi:hypothetical protein